MTRARSPSSMFDVEARRSVNHIIYYINYYNISYKPFTFEDVEARRLCAALGTWTECPPPTTTSPTTTTTATTAASTATAAGTTAAAAGPGG